ncbi:MAG: hypothetical protein GXP55_17090, partial [Deltaproteobacteria bacterium]|nr:hypothetical protein [Deltaproteobacteria bacterium]
MVEQLGEQLLAAGVATATEVDAAAPGGVGSGTRFARALVMAKLAEDALAGFFVSRGAGPLADGDLLRSAPPEVSGLLPGEMARSLQTLPIALEGEALVVAMLDPWDAHALEELTRMTGRPILARVARHGELVRAIEDRHPLTNRARRAPPSEEPVLELV